MVLTSKEVLENLVVKRSTTYRAVYFKHNKGIFRKWYLCAYCRTKLLESQVVEVDHCIAVNAVKKRWYFRLFFTLMGKDVNDNLNLVASCRKCNRSKSDKAGKWIMRGAVGKVYHLILQGSSEAFLKSLKSIWFVYVALFMYISYLVFKLLLL